MKYGPNVGMILIHKGIVRGFSRDGSPVKGMVVEYDPSEVEAIVEEMLNREGIEHIDVKINSGRLSVGDEIMTVTVAGRYRRDVLPVMDELLSRIKAVVKEREF